MVMATRAALLVDALRVPRVGSDSAFLHTSEQKALWVVHAVVRRFTFIGAVDPFEFLEESAVRRQESLFAALVARLTKKRKRASDDAVIDEASPMDEEAEEQWRALFDAAVGSRSPREFDQRMRALDNLLTKPQINWLASLGYVPPSAAASVDADAEKGSQTTKKWFRATRRTYPETSQPFLGNP